MVITRNSKFRDEWWWLIGMAEEAHKKDGSSDVCWEG
jgi:hypothetical protein